MAPACCAPPPSQLLNHHLPSELTSSRKLTIPTLPQAPGINPSSESLALGLALVPEHDIFEFYYHAQNIGVVGKQPLFLSGVSAVSGEWVGRWGFESLTL